MAEETRRPVYRIKRRGSPASVRDTPPVVLSQSPGLDAVKPALPQRDPARIREGLGVLVLLELELVAATSEEKRRARARRL